MSIAIRLVILSLCSIIAVPLAARQSSDTAYLRAARAYAEALENDTISVPLLRYSFDYDDRRLAPSQGRTTTVTYWTDTVGRIQKIETAQYRSQRLWTNAYYMRLGSLLYAIEEETLNLKSGEEAGRVVWTATYAFKEEKLVALASNGHGKSETDDWEPEVYVPAAFKAARARAESHARRALAAP